MYGICELPSQLSIMRMKFFKQRIIWFVILFGVNTAQNLPKDWLGYWKNSGQTIITNRNNQLILATAALAALGATQVDMRVKNYAREKGLLSDPVSHFGDLYGGTWGHWILWSSILATSAMNKDSKDEYIAKMQFSTFALITNGIITVGMKRAFGRVRPNGVCCESFPSGHTSHSFTIAAIAQELYGNKVGAFAYGIASLVAVSRINDNKHYLSDVLFGAALGTAVGRGFTLNYSEYMINDNNVGVVPQWQLKITIPI